MKDVGLSSSREMIAFFQAEDVCMSWMDAREIGGMIMNEWMVGRRVEDDGWMEGCTWLN